MKKKLNNISTVVAFMEIVDPNNAENSIRFHTAGSSLYSRTSKWGKFTGVGGLLAISALADETRTTAHGFRLAFTFPKNTPTSARAALLREAIRLDIADRDLCLWLLDRPPKYALVEDEDECKKMMAGGKLATCPKLLMLGKIGTPKMTPNGVVLTCYTAAAQLDKPYGAPVLWSDYQQRVLMPLTFFDTPEGCEAIVKEMEASQSTYSAAKDSITKLIQEDGAFQFATYEFSNSGVSFP